MTNYNIYRDCVFNNDIEPDRFCYMYTTEPGDCNNYQIPSNVQIEEINMDAMWVFA